MPDKFLPYGLQSVDEEDIARVVEVLRSPYLTTGPAVAEFEKALCTSTGASYAVALNSGTAALHAAYFGAGLSRGDDIVTTPLTFAATANAARYLGANVRFADVEADTGNIDPDAVAAALTDRTRLISVVDFTGQPADYDRIDPIARSQGIPVIADAAHSLGATYHGRSVGTLALASTLSFHPVKAITTGEGGAVVSSDRELAGKVARFRTHGIEREPEKLQSNEGPWWHEMHDLGFNYRLTDIQSVLGTNQLRRLAAFVTRRRAIAKVYDERLADLSALQLPVVRDGVEPAWHLYVLRTRDASRRRAFFERLRALQLGVQVHYIPVHYHPYYQALGFRRGQFPNAEAFYASAVSIPIFPELTDDDLDSSVDRIRRAAKDTL